MKKIIKYYWICQQLEDDKFYSDWENAINCEICNKKIVHVYTTDDFKNIGKECAKKYLGYKENQIKKIIQKSIDENYKKEEEKIFVFKTFNKYKNPDVNKAINDCILRNRMSINSSLTVYGKQNEYYCIPAQCQEMYDVLLTDNLFLKKNIVR